MPRLRDVLYRFRPAGTPGRAAAAAVPVDRAADLTVELEPVFARLAPTELVYEEMVQTARREAAATVAAATAEAERVVAVAREQVGTERVLAAEGAQQRLDAESAMGLAGARDEIEELRRHAAEQAPGYVDRVLGSLAPLLGPAGPADAGSHAHGGGAA